MTNLPTPWQTFYNSQFKYRPTRTIFDGRTYYKTNNAKWAKQ